MFNFYHVPTSNQKEQEHCKKKNVLIFNNLFHISYFCSATGSCKVHTINEGHFVRVVQHTSLLLAINIHMISHSAGTHEASKNEVKISYSHDLGSFIGCMLILSCWSSTYWYSPLDLPLRTHVEPPKSFALTLLCPHKLLLTIICFMMSPTSLEQNKF